MNNLWIKNDNSEIWHKSDSWWVLLGEKCNTICGREIKIHISRDKKPSHKKAMFCKQCVKQKKVFKADSKRILKLETEVSDLKKNVKKLQNNSNW